MRNVCKKLGLGILTAALLAGVIFGDISVSASINIVGMFDTWTGRGETSVRIDCIDADAFLKLVNRETNEEINPIYYTILADGSDTVVTLKEEYLQTLADGDYRFTCYFSGQGQEVQMLGPVAVIPDPYGFALPSMSARYTLTRLTYKGETVDPSYYTVNMDKGYPVITLKEGAPSAGDLMAYFTADYLDQWVFLTVDRQTLPSAEETTAASPAVSSEAPASAAQAASHTPPSSAQPASSGEATPSAPPAVSALSGGGAPESGNASTGSGRPDALAAGALLLLPLSAVCCAILLKRKKKKNTL